VSPKPVPKFQLPRRSVASQDDAFREIEQRIEGRANGIAGQAGVSVNAHSDVQTSVQTLRENASAPPARAIVKRRNGRLRRRRTIYLPTDLDRALARFCTGGGREVSETVAAALELYLAAKRST